MRPDRCDTEPNLLPELGVSGGAASPRSVAAPPANVSTTLGPGLSLGPRVNLWGTAEAASLRGLPTWGRRPRGGQPHCSSREETARGPLKVEARMPQRLPRQEQETKGQETSKRAEPRLQTALPVCSLALTIINAL